MIKKQLGKTGFEISSIVFGGWQSSKQYWVGIDDAETIQAHKVALEHGITTFDTAEEYGAGHSERILASALAPHRNEIVICTKVSWNNMSRAKVMEACERSCKNLGTDHIDLYQIHWPAGTFGSPVVPIEETMGAFLDLKTQGKIRAIGVSNFSLPQLKAAEKVGRVDAIQPCYSLFFRNFEKETLAYCEQQGIAVLAYSPLAQGLLTGRFDERTKFDKGDNRRANKLFHGDHLVRAASAVAELRPIAARLNMELSHLALAWLCHRPSTVAIAGARNPAQALSNAAAGDVRLSQSDWDEVERIGRKVSEPLLEEALMWNW